MAPVRLSDVLREEYRQLFDECLIRKEKSELVNGIIAKIASNRERYDKVAARLGIPWYFVAIVHYMERSLDFSEHLINGDPLSDRTVNVPEGRPSGGKPPFTWEESATDALTFRRVDRWEDWSLEGLLYQLEQYNGWGYRLNHPDTLSPYLWSYSNHYTNGSYDEDGRWLDSAVFEKAGAAMLLKRMEATGAIECLPR